MWKIGEMETSICTDYNYLGQIVQSNGSLDKHLEQKRNSIAYKDRDIKCLVKDSVMNKMNSNINLLYNYINPVYYPHYFLELKHGTLPVNKYNS